MDINVGRSRPGTMRKMMHLYARLTSKGKIVLGCLLVLVLYLLMPRSGGSSKTDLTSSGDDGFFETDSSDGSAEMDEFVLSRDKFKTLSDILNYSPKVTQISLNYLSLPPFLDSSNKFPHYTNGGNMLFNRNVDYVRLVKDSPKNVGYLFSKIPISTDDLSGIEIEVDFKIHGEQSKINLIGDGMAIWLTTEQLKMGEVFGMQEDFNGVGFFVDTYKNYNGKKNRNAFPYLSIQRNRGHTKYYDKGMDGIDTQYGGCSLRNLYNHEGDEPSKLKLTYIRQAKILEILSDVEGTGNWKQCYRRENVEVDDLFPVGRPLYFGVSAETGELHHSVDIYKLEAKTFRTKSDDFITEIDSLAEGIKFVDAVDENSGSAGDSPSGTRRRHKPRKSLNRLRRQERILRERDQAKYNSSHGFVGWFFGLVWFVIKMIFYVLLACIALYGCVIAYRVWKDKQKKKNIGGLL